MHHESPQFATPAMRRNDVPESVASWCRYDHKYTDDLRIAPIDAARKADLQDLERKPDTKTAATDIVHSAKAMGRSGQRCRPSIPQQGERK